MAKVTITIEDKQDGVIGITANFDPPITRDGDATAAQHVAVTMLESIRNSEDYEEKDVAVSREEVDA